MNASSESGECASLISIARVVACLLIICDPARRPALKLKKVVPRGATQKGYASKADKPSAGTSHLRSSEPKCRLTYPSGFSKQGAGLALPHGLPHLLRA